MMVLYKTAIHIYMHDIVWPLLSNWKYNAQNVADIIKFQMHLYPPFLLSSQQAIKVRNDFLSHRCR